MQDIINNIRETLREYGDEQTQASGRRFFKGYVPPSYGVKAALVRKISKEHFKAFKDRDKAEVFDLCETLWRSGYVEESIIACDWSYAVRKAYAKLSGDYNPMHFDVYFFTR